MTTDRTSIPAVLTLGPESTGNHLAVELLIKCGCAGAARDSQPWDDDIPDAGAVGPIVWGTSVPRDLRWPDLAGRVERVERAGYRPHLVGLARGLLPTLESQLANGRVSDFGMAERQIAGAYAMIWREISEHEMRDYPYSMIVYEELVARPYDVARWLVDRINPGALHYPRPGSLSFVEDRNGKHWET